MVRCRKTATRFCKFSPTQCVKATFFLVGEQAKANPEGVRKVRDAGHTVCHPHPAPSVGHAAVAARPRAERGRRRHRVGDGGARPTAPRPRRSSAFPAFPATTASRPTPSPRASRSGAPIFRPTTGDRISSQRVYDLAIRRLEAKGKGILLLHDIQARTVAALPRILQTLKARGYRIVHVVPATPERPATPTEPQQWQMHPTTETVAISRWPKIPNFVYAATPAFPAPAWFDFDWRERRARRLDAAHARRAAAAADEVAAATGSVAGQPRDRIAGSGRKPVRDAGNRPGHMLGTLRRAEQAAQAALETEAAAKSAPVRAGKSRRQARGALVRQAHGEQTRKTGRAPGPACGRTRRAETGRARQEECARGPGGRPEEALKPSGLTRLPDANRRSPRSKTALPQFVTILAMQSRMTRRGTAGRYTTSSRRRVGAR